MEVRSSGQHYSTLGIWSIWNKKEQREKKRDIGEKGEHWGSHTVNCVRPSTLWISPSGSWDREEEDWESVPLFAVPISFCAWNKKEFESEEEKSPFWL